ncbi:hypothetical protein, partial [Novosphingobium rosa]|uniref:hypothetical protein n=1 Tax=Novosphingobium rosa TaxID=76978 RepID=UPI001C3FBB56
EVHAAGTKRWWAGIEEYAGKGWAMVILDRVLWSFNTRRRQSLPACPWIAFKLQQSEGSSRQAGQLKSKIARHRKFLNGR